ncbi:hypothetical protein A4X13_0g3179 [Tilletia indica]|uniref:Uncharacterized protein n=1 Tax=Tilletia indica TaxID=43049 RepID=A0A177TWV2_9BASI|nr:hypothetical protein A4X13_0g3179 [Tilletia indica]
MKAPARTLLYFLLLLSATALCASSTTTNPSTVHRRSVLPEAAKLAIAPAPALHEARSQQHGKNTTPLRRLKSRQSDSVSANGRVGYRSQSADTRVMAARAPAPDEKKPDPDAAFIGALRGAKLNAYADLVQGKTDFILADGGDKVVLAMTDEAVARLPKWVKKDPTQLQAVLLQHVLVGAFPDLPSNLTSSQDNRVHTIGYSMLTQGSFVNLPGGNGQAVALSGSRGFTKGTTEAEEDDAANGNGKGFVNEALNDSKLRGDSFKVGTVTVVPIDRPIMVPGTLQYTLDHVVGEGLNYSTALFNPPSLTGSKKNGTGFEKVAAAYRAAVSARMGALSETTGVTLFVPSPNAVNNFLSSEAGRTLMKKAKKNGGQEVVEALMTILGQHTIEARTLYSPIMRDLCDDSDAPPVTTSSGQLLTFKCAGSGKGGKYPTSLRLFKASDKDRTRVVASANLVQTDIIFANGVIHLIDAVLFSLDSDKDAAISARSAALRKAESSVAGPLSGANCGDGGMNAGSALGPDGVVRPPLGQLNATGHGLDGTRFSGALAGVRPSSFGGLISGVVAALTMVFAMGVLI